MSRTQCSRISAMENWTTLLLGLILLWESTDGGIYLPKAQYRFFVGNTLKSNDIIGTIHAFQHRCLKCNASNSQIDTPGSKDIFTSLDRFHIHIRVLPEVKKFQLEGTVVFDLHIKCEPVSHHPLANYYEPLMRARVILVPDSSKAELTSLEVKGNTRENDVTKMAEIQAPCPGNAYFVYNVIENTEPGVLEDIGMGNPNVSQSIVNRSKQGDYVSLNASTGELRLIRSPDREEGEKITVELSCKVKSGGHEVNISRIVTINVYDVDDNPPFTHFLKPVQFSHDNKSSLKSVIELMTYDYDKETITSDKTYRVHINDSLGVITLNSLIFHSIRMKLASGTRIKTVVNLRPQNFSEPYTVDVTVEDTCYEPDANKTDTFSWKAVHRIVVPANLNMAVALPEPLTPLRVEAHIDASAAGYSLVSQLAKSSNTPVNVNTTFSIDGVSPQAANKTFAVTSTGDVYITNDSSPSLLTSIMVTLTRTDSGVQTEKVELAILVSKNPAVPKLEKCVLGCSSHNTSEQCTKSCGLGAPTGRCGWRSGALGMSSHYSTCTPSINTCPDGVCSELEKLHYLICPQDCTTGTVTGQATKKASGIGIDTARGTCWCESELTDGRMFCNCQPPTLTVLRNRTRPGISASGVRQPEKADTLVVNNEDSPTCNTSCKATIAGFLAAVVVVALVVVLTWVAWRRRKRRRQVPQLKHVGSLVSINAVPSDYIVDDPHGLRGHIGRQASSPASSRWGVKPGLGHEMVDDRWEFPRQYLTLEHVIGEGEFGQVVRAQAFMLRGQEGNTVVAVKMLKADASGAEYQDLVSEIQVLKEVTHPNVIELLGVCTQKGPLYVIVEYCELGSLRNFLRSSKFRNKCSWDNRMKSGNEDSLDNLAEPRNLTCRDLFSFAWQIAKGMDYLASLKIVHRDLAARNVLVTESLKLKISDFGLSRDVYEADTYLKMSKGRIPVKWMAPESLYAQVYTTKSDIWSYGIVLWEIVTLGASPYPGIPPERLFPLLSTGYRMDRPEDCPDELYAIMQKCWKAEPENRPPFSALRDILDSLLQQNTEYLDLSNDSFILHGNNSGCEDKLSVSHPSTHGAAKPQYSNVCAANHCKPNVYVATHWEEDSADNDDECPEKSRLLINNEGAATTQPETVKQTEIVLDKITRDGRKASSRVLVHENLTYV